MKHHALCALLLLSLGASPGLSQTIGVYFNKAATQCGIRATPFSSGTMYLIARLGGAAGNGIAGAEFRLDGFPPDWFPVTVPSPIAIFVDGNPLANGCNITFPSCQREDGGPVLLYTVQYFVTSSIPFHLLSVRAHLPPNTPGTSCPVLALCDSPIFTRLCAAGGQGWINPFWSNDCDPLAIESSSWSGVKQLYE